MKNINCIVCNKEMLFIRNRGLFGLYTCELDNHYFEVTAEDWTFILQIDNLKIKSLGYISGRPFSFEMNKGQPGIPFEFKMSETYTTLLKINKLLSFM